MARKSWTENEIFYLINQYNHIPIKKLASRLGRTYSSVQRKAQNLGICTPKNKTHQTWNEKELKTLEREYEKTGPVQLSKKLNRSKTSIARKAQSLGLNTYINDMLSLKTVANCFHSDARVIHRWIDKFELPMQKQQHGSITMYRISAEDFWKWAKEHQNIIPWQKYEFLSILPQPAWVLKIIQQQSTKQSRKPISAIEIQHVKLAREKHTPFAQIAKDLNRTENSVKHIYRKIQQKKGTI